MTMKRKFTINFILMLAAAFTTLYATKAGIWFTACGAALLCAVVIYKLFKQFDECTDALNDEKQCSRLIAKKSTDTERELLFYKTIMNGVDTAVITATDSGHIEWANTAAQAITQNSDILRNEIVAAIKEEKSDVCIDGKEYAISASLITTRNSSQYIIALKNIHSSIEKSKVESWHKLVRVLTHEIMNSMTPIISLSSTLCNSIKGEEIVNDNMENVRHGLEIISRRNSGLLSFVENYRKLTHLAAPEKRPVTMNELIADLRKLFPQAYITFDTEGTADTTIQADRTQMEQVLINLLKNAVEACDERERNSNGDDYHKQITVSTQVDKKKKMLTIGISDNGIGILKSAQQQIFIPFFTTKKSGSGIGLSLCKQIIINHGGDIDITSQDESGCFVECKLPLE